MSDKFMDLFDESVDYPEPAIDPFPLGTLYCYVSQTLLDGMINYIDIKAAYLITRYQSHSRNIASAGAFLEAGAIHSRLGSMGDDLLILGRPEGSMTWWFFWYDCDVSDCQMGRFDFFGVEDELLRRFHEFAEWRSWQLSDSYSGSSGREGDSLLENKGHKPAIPIDPNSFKGWLSW